MRQIGTTDRDPFATTVTLTDALLDEESDEEEDKEVGLGGLFGVGKKRKDDAEVDNSG